MVVLRLASIVVIAMTLVVAQLRVATFVADPCCCPDPASCHCPDHDLDDHGGPTMQACGKTGSVVVSPNAPAVIAPPVAVEVAARPTREAPPPLPDPHDPPDPDRPPAPS